MATAYAKINPEMLTWAQQRARLSLTALARKLTISEEKLHLWETGEKPLTFKQAQTFANKTYIPFGYLFLQQPPEEQLPLPDLRTIGGEQPERPSAELLDIVKIVIQRQAWYQEYMNEQLLDAPVVVGQFSTENSVIEIVDNIRQVLAVAAHPVRGTWEDYYRDLVSRIENTGIMVMREGYIKHWTRALQVSEFRGFAIASEQAPVIFVNHADVPSARLFTLIHELCHIWLGVSGISDGDPRNNRQEEVLCNAVAAEFLVPSTEFLNLWLDHIDTWQDNLPVLAAHFRVSTWVVARRAQTLNKISVREYQAYIREQEEAYRNRVKKKGAPGLYKVRKAQLSERFSKAVVSEALSGKLLLRDAGQLLNIKPNKIETLLLLFKMKGHNNHRESFN